MNFLGDFTEDETEVIVDWSTNDSDGAAVTATAVTISIYKDGGTTEKTTSNGVTSSIDFDGKTGVHQIVIDTSNDTGDGGFWVAGGDYKVVVEATVAAQSVKATVGSFSLQKRYTRGTDASNTVVPPSVSEFNARTLVAANYFDPVIDTVVNVTNVSQATVVAATAAFIEDLFSVDSGQTSGDEITGSLVLEVAKVVCDRVLTGATHNIPSSLGRRLRGLQDFGNYLGSIHIDTIGGTAGTVVDENGTVENPVDTWADALTLNATLGYNSFTLGNGSIILLTGDSTGYTLKGLNWELQLGGQIITRMVAMGANEVTGIGLDGAISPRFIECLFGDVTLPPFEAVRCCLTGTITASAPGDYLLVRCHSLIAGITTPIFDYGAAVGNVNLSMPGYARGIEIQNLDAAGTDEFSISGNGQIIYAASCSGDVQQSGAWRETNTGGVTINRDLLAQNSVDIVATVGVAGAGLGDLGGMSTAMKAEVNTEADTALIDYDPPTRTEATADKDAILAVGSTGPWTSGGTAPTVEQIDAELTSNHGAGAWITGATGGGTGANTITITVDDGTNPIEGAFVRVTKVGNDHVLATNASGQAIFSLDAAEWSIAITAPNHSFTPTTFTVSVTASETFSMTVDAIVSPPVDPSMCRVTGFLKTLDNQIAVDTEFTFELITLDKGPAKNSFILTGRIVSATSDETGFVDIEIARNDGITPVGSKYLFRSPDTRFREQEVTLDTSTQNIADLIT